MKRAWCLLSCACGANHGTARRMLFFFTRFIYRKEGKLTHTQRTLREHYSGLFPSKKHYNNMKMLFWREDAEYVSTLIRKNLLMVADVIKCWLQMCLCIRYIRIMLHCNHVWKRGFINKSNFITYTIPMLGFRFLFSVWEKHLQPHWEDFLCEADVFVWSWCSHYHDIMLALHQSKKKNQQSCFWHCNKDKYQYCWFSGVYCLVGFYIV